MSPNAWTEGMFPLLGGVEDKYKQTKTLDTETTTRLSLQLNTDSLFIYKTKLFVYIRWYYHSYFVQKVESEKRTKKIQKNAG